MSTIPTISTNLPIISHLNSLNAQNTTSYGVAKRDPGLGHAQKCGGIKPVNRLIPLLKTGSRMSDLVSTVI